MPKIFLIIFESIVKHSISECFAMVARNSWKWALLRDKRAWPKMLSFIRKMLSLKFFGYLILLWYVAYYNLTTIRFEKLLVI